MSITSNDPIFTVEDSEFGYAATSFTPIAYGGTIAMIVPKIAGNIKSTGRETININNLFANAPECKPAFSRVVNTQKTISPVLKHNMNWLNLVNADGVVPAGTRFTVNFVNGNINNSSFATG